MSLRDGQLKSDDLYLTNDVAFAAYLVLRGYELLGTADEGIVNDYGKPIKKFGLMPPPELTENLPISMTSVRAIERDIADKWDEFENRFWISPINPNDKINAKEFISHYRGCFRALDRAIRKPL